MIPELPKRPDVSHKGDYGTALLIGGSVGMSGAIALSGKACMRAGAGLLRIAAPEASMPPIASFDPCYMTIPVAHDEAGRMIMEARDQLREFAQTASAIGIGPGMGQSEELIDFTTWIYSRISAPMVVDADALNCLAENRSILSKPGGPRIFTPHPGELRRLLDDDVSTPKDLQYRAEAFAREAGVIIVVKGHRSIITDGTKRKQNTTGNSGMATGGSGDVLTGIITGLLCQGIETFDAAHLGCLIHGLAGDAGARRIGKISLMATDIIEYIPKAIRAIKRKERRRKQKVKPQDSNPNQRV